MRRRLLKKLPDELASARKSLPNNTPVRLMFQDEARFGRVGLPHRCWASAPCRPVCHSQIIREYIYAYSAISPLDGKIDLLIAPRAGADVKELFLRQVAERFKDEHIVMAMDKVPWHTTGKLNLPENMTLELISKVAFLEKIIVL